MIRLIPNQHQKPQPTKHIKVHQGLLVGLHILTPADQQVNQQRQHIQRRKVQRHHIVRHIQQRIVRIIQRHGTLQGAVVQYGILVVGILFLISLDFLLIVALH